VWEGEYHDFTKTQKYEVPDLTVGFNSGFTGDRREYWKPTLEFLAHVKHPKLFTTTNKLEMEEESNFWNGRGVNFIQKGEVNRWHARCPTIDTLSPIPNSFKYDNHYWYIIGPGKS
jgi:hypothetical protein